MKRRQAFVANSSSSSFLIAYLDIEKADYSDKVPEFVKNQVNKMMKLFFDGDVFKTVEEFNKMFFDQYSCGQETIEELLEEEGNYLNNLHSTCIKLLNDGYSIVDISVDNCNIDLQESLSSIPREDDGSGFVLISDDY